MTEQLNLNSLSLDSQNIQEELILKKTSSLSLHDNDFDQDIEMEEISTPSRSNHFFRKSILKHEYTPYYSSPLKEAYNINEDNELIKDEDDIMTDGEASFSKVFTKTTSLILSPTTLGAKLATNGSSNFNNLEPILLTSKLKNVLIEESETSSIKSLNINNLKNRNKSKTSTCLKKYINIEDNNNSYDSTSTFIPSIKKASLDKSPIQFQMHHHHYYPSSPSIYDTDNDDSIMLPSPWSKIAEPKAPTPYLISSYLQLLFNTITSSIAIYILISGIKIVKSDINLKMEEYTSEIIMEISKCSRSYFENKCDPKTRVSALESLCIEWERCMNRDPLQYAGKASVSAETLGVILNSLIEPIGIKAIFIFILGFIIWLFISNFLFGFIRAKSYYGWSFNQKNNHISDQMIQNPSLLPNTPGGFKSSPSINLDYETSTP